MARRESGRLSSVNRRDLRRVAEEIKEFYCALLWAHLLLSRQGMDFRAIAICFCQEKPSFSDFPYMVVYSQEWVSNTIGYELGRAELPIRRQQTKQSQWGGFDTFVTSYFEVWICCTTCWYQNLHLLGCLFSRMGFKYHWIWVRESLFLTSFNEFWQRTLSFSKNVFR